MLAKSVNKIDLLLVKSKRLSKSLQKSCKLFGFAQRGVRLKKTEHRLNSNPIHKIATYSRFKVRISEKEVKLDKPHLISVNTCLNILFFMTFMKPHTLISSVKLKIYNWDCLP